MNTYAYPCSLSMLSATTMEFTAMTASSSTCSQVANFRVQFQCDQRVGGASRRFGLSLPMVSLVSILDIARIYISLFSYPCLHCERLSSRWMSPAIVHIRSTQKPACSPLLRSAEASCRCSDLRKTCRESQEGPQLGRRGASPIGRVADC